MDDILDNTHDIYDNTFDDDEELGYFDSNEEVDESMYLDEIIEEPIVAIKMIERGKFTDIPIDVVKEIYMYTHLDDILSLMNTNKLYNKIFDDLFWMQKFDHDQLPIDDSDDITLIRKYIYALRAANLLHLNDLEYDLFPGINGLDMKLPINITGHSDISSVLYLIPTIDNKHIRAMNIEYYKEQKYNGDIVYVVNVTVYFTEMKPIYKVIILNRYQMIDYIVKFVLTKKLILTDNKKLPYTISAIDKIFNDNELFYNLDKDDKEFNSIKLLNHRKKWILEHPYYKF
jgi:hypothetical protein